MEYRVSLFVTPLRKLLNQSHGVEENNELIRSRGAVGLFWTWLISQASNFSACRFYPISLEAEVEFLDLIFSFQAECLQAREGNGWQWNNNHLP